MVEIRPIQKNDQEPLKMVITEVLSTFGYNREDYIRDDHEIHRMYAIFNQKRHFYCVAQLDGAVLGGSGVAPFDQTTCVLRKMYLLPEYRGRGIGKRLLLSCLNQAVEMGYERCYIESTNEMRVAHELYKKYGFVELSCRKGAHRNNGCNKFFEKELSC